MPPSPTSNAPARGVALRKVARDAVRDAAMARALLPHAAPTDDRPQETPSNAGARLPRALRDRVLDKVAAQVHFARKHWNKPFRMPTVGFDLRGKTAGTAMPGSWHIRINAVLLEENADLVVDDTVVHELAHLLTTALHGARAQAHGEHWQGVMRTLGVEPSRTHTMNTLNSAIGRLVFKYRCECAEVPFTESKHRAVRGGARYRCVQCKHLVIYTGEVRRNGVWTEDPKAGGKPALPLSAALLAAAPSPARRPSASLAFAAPSQALLRYARSLAFRLGIALEPHHLADRSQLGAFVERAKAAVARLPDAGAARPAASDAPTPRQLLFAQAIARRKGLAPDPAALASKLELSRWIARHGG